MDVHLQYLSMIFIYYVAANDEVITWDDAFTGCQVKHNAILLPKDYWESSIPRFTQDILSELNNVSAAWINGQRFMSWCRNKRCFSILKMALHRDASYRYVCGNGNSSRMKVTNDKVPCVPMNMSVSDITNSLQDSIPPGLYWTNMMPTDVNDRKCMSLRPTQQHTQLALAEYPCDRKILAVCITRPLIEVPYPVRLLLDVTENPYTESTINSAHGIEEKLTTTDIKPVMMGINAGTTVPDASLDFTGDAKQSVFPNLSPMHLLYGSCVLGAFNMLMTLVLLVYQCRVSIRLKTVELSRTKSTDEVLIGGHTYSGLKDSSSKTDTNRVNLEQSSSSWNDDGYLCMKNSDIYRRRMAGDCSAESQYNPYDEIPASKISGSVVGKDGDNVSNTLVKQIVSPIFVPQYIREGFDSHVLKDKNTYV